MTTVDKFSYIQIKKEPQKIKLMIIEEEFVRWKKRSGSFQWLPISFIYMFIHY